MTYIGDCMTTTTSSTLGGNAGVGVGVNASTTVTKSTTNCAPTYSVQVPTYKTTMTFVPAKANQANAKMQ